MEEEMPDPVLIDLKEKLTHISEYWKPHIVAELNGQQVRLAKLRGDFEWHHHENEDELFFVLNGRLRMDLRDRNVWIEEGQMFIVPKGTEHKPYTEAEVSVMLFEPASTLHTGAIETSRTVREFPRL